MYPPVGGPMGINPGVSYGYPPGLVSRLVSPIRHYYDTPPTGQSKEPR